MVEQFDGSEIDFIAPKKRHGVVRGVYSALGAGFTSKSLDTLDLTYEGIAGDRHSGLTRKSNSREPWYEKGTQMRNEQQLSFLSQEELSAIANELNIEKIDPEWLGCSICVSGIEHLSLLPPRTILMFEGGVSVRIDGSRGPCKISGRALVKQYEGRDDLEFAFVRAAKHRRGLVGWVEIPGTIKAGEKFVARIWEQCIYPG
ncbi:hypothetical protein MNBD_ALPHA11-1953 [hydrothermal vent metagenome]|uniref:MOSC domain-containing protein n=1 Tax=hydrothermal vent metagenome TaxID=652676 RepID=A0A3B0UKI8_9ZZZZ